jgi:nuclear RNA export factor
VKKFNLMPPGHGGNARDAAVLFKLAKELKPPVIPTLVVDNFHSQSFQVQSLNLSKNQLTGQHLSLLSHYLPGLVNLSLQDNQINTYRDIDAISGKKDRLVALKELLLAGNPLREEMIKKDAEQFKKSVSNF